MYKTVFELWHFKIGPDDEWDLDDEAQCAKDIGIYSSEQSAKAAIERLKDKPGFRNWQLGFRILERELDRDHWEEGFINPYDDPDWPRA